jgi:hypothetical protein
VLTVDSDDRELSGRDSIDLSLCPLPLPSAKDKELGGRDSIDTSVDPVPPVSGQNIPTKSVPEPSDRPAYIVCSDDETGSQLLREMKHVLGSTKAQEQLDWAEKTLRYFHCKSEHERRASALRNPSRNNAGSRNTPLHSTARKTVQLLLNDHPRALFIAARYFGLDAANSLVYYHHAATKGFLRANYYLGRHYEKAKQDNAKTLSLQYYNTGAEGGDATCRYVS